MSIYALGVSFGKWQWIEECTVFDIREILSVAQSLEILGIFNKVPGLVKTKLSVEWNGFNLTLVWVPLLTHFLRRSQNPHEMSKYCSARHAAQKTVVDMSTGQVCDYFSCFVFSSSGKNYVHVDNWKMRFCSDHTAPLNKKQSLHQLWNITHFLFDFFEIK